jgi:hypothetical protein
MQEVVTMKRKRPTGITILAILYYIAGAVMFLGGCSMLWVLYEVKTDPGAFALSVGFMQYMAIVEYETWFWGFSALSLFLSVLLFFLGWGLWKLKKWARIIVIVLHSLGVLGSLGSMCGILGLAYSYEPYRHHDPTAAIYGAIVGLAIGGYIICIIYWFASHGEYFD